MTEPSASNASRVYSTIPMLATRFRKVAEAWRAGDIDAFRGECVDCAEELIRISDTVTRERDRKPDRNRNVCREPLA